jgi:molecular chaperone GrpE (heat shock protein)
MSTAASAAAGAAAFGDEPAADAGAESEAAAGAAQAHQGLTAPGVAAAYPQGAKSLVKQIDDLKKQQAQARAERQKISRELRNAQRRKRRLKARARQLSNDDLVTVLLMRSDVGAAAAAAEDAPQTPEPLAGSSSPKKAKVD